MGFFRTKGKHDPDGTERRIETLYMVKHKDKNFDPDEARAFQVAQGSMQQQEQVATQINKEKVDEEEDPRPSG